MKTWSTHLALTLVVTVFWCVGSLWFFSWECILETLSEEVQHLPDLPELIHNLVETGTSNLTPLTLMDFGNYEGGLAGLGRRLSTIWVELRFKLQSMLWIGTLRLFGHRAEAACALLFAAAYLYDGVYLRRLRELSFQNTHPSLSYFATHLSVLSLWGIVLSLMTPGKEALTVTQALTLMGCLCMCVAIAHNRRHLG